MPSFLTERNFLHFESGFLWTLPRLLKIDQQAMEAEFRSRLAIASWPDTLAALPTRWL